MSLNVLKADVYRGKFSKWTAVSVLLITVLAADSFAQMPSAAARQTTPFAVASSLPAKPVLLASLRPAPGIVWQRVKTDDRPLDGPVLYQIIFRSSATPGHIPRIANNFTLTNSLISDNGTQVAIGGLAINGNTGIISFANGQTFPGTGGVASVTSGNNFITIGGTGTNPTVALNTTTTDTRYLQLGGGTMSGMITFANGQAFPGTGTVTSIATGAGLGGGPITGTGTISITSGGVTNAMLANPSVTINTLGGSGLAGGSALPLGGTLSLNIANGGVTNAMLANPALTVSAGSGLAGGGSVALGGTTTLNLDTTFTNAHYLQLNGGTLTGALSGTTASFSGAGSFSGLFSAGGGLRLPAVNTATPGGGFGSNTFDAIASVYNSGNATAENQLFRWQTEAVGNNTVNPAGSFNLLFSGTANNFTPTETGLSIASNGRISFAPGQVFPVSGLPAAGGDASGTLSGLTVVGLQGTPLASTAPGSGQVLQFNGTKWAPAAASSGTVTNVSGTAPLTVTNGTTIPNISLAAGGITNSLLANPSLTVSAGSGLTGGGSVNLGGSITLSIANAGVTNAMLANPALTVSAGSGLTGGGSVALGGTTTLNLDASFTNARYLQLSGGTLTGGLALGATGTANTGAGATSNPTDWTASVFNSNTSTAQAQLFRWQAEPAGNNSANPSGSFNLLFSGTANNFTPAETGLVIASNGRITFAPGQSFPAAGLPAAGGDLSGTLSNATVAGLQGTPLVNTPPTSGQVLKFNGTNWAPATIVGGGGGTVTSVGSGLGLTGGPITNSGTLSIDATVVPQLGASNTFTASNLFAGGVQYPPLGNATPGGGFNSSALDLAASSYNSGAGSAVNQRFRWQAEPLNNNSNNASGTLNLLFSVGNNPLAETGLSIANNGQITFAGGQTFPGSVTSVAPGDGSITIGGTASAPTVAVANAGVTNSKLANPSLIVAAGAGLTGGGSVALGGSTTLSIASAGVTNTMLQNSSVTVNTGTGLSGGGAVALGGTLTLNNTGVLSVAASGPLASSGGTTPNISLTGTVPIANGGTGITAAPASAGQYLRSSGVGTWAVGGIQSGDVPSLSGTYVDLVSNQSIAGNKSFSQTVNAAVTTGTGVNASSSDANGTGLFGVASDVTGAGTAVGTRGRTASPFGVGVLGETTDTSPSGTPIAVQGQTSSPGGVGVFGSASDTTDNGFAIGVEGRIAGPNGYAVLGVATDTTGGTGGTGGTVGVRGVSASPNGVAIQGRATSTTANANGVGVNGRSDSPNGVGVRGFAADTTGSGLAVGVLGFTSKISNPAALFNNNDANCTGASCQILWGQAKGSNVFKVLGNGAVQAAAYQDLNGNPINAGTVTSVGTGAGLTGGPITGSGTISIANAGVTNAMLAANSVTNANIANAGLSPAKITGTAAILGANTFTGDQSITGNLGASGTVTGGTFTGNGSGLTNLNASNLSSGTIPVTALTGSYNINISGNAGSATNAAQLGGIVATNYARLDISNNFTGIQNLGFNSTIAVTRFNEGTTGTTQNRLAKLDSSGAAIITAPGDTGGVLGIVVAGSGTSGQVQITVAGVASCNFDVASQHAGNYVTISATTAGECHDAGSAFPMGTQVIGRVGFTGGTSSNSVYLYGPEQRATSVTAADNTINIAGTPSVPALSVNGANVTGVNAAQLGGLGPSGYAQLAGNNSFTGVFNTFQSNSIFTTLSVRNNGGGGVLAGTNGGGTIFNFDSNGNQTLTTNGGNVYLGNAGCSAPFTGIGFGNSGMSGCANFSLVGNGTDTVVNRPTGGSIYFRENNATEMSIAPGGAVTVNGSLTVGSGVNAAGGGLKHARSASFNIAGNANSFITINWNGAFADLNYTVTASIEANSDGFSGLRVGTIFKLNGSIQVNVINTSNTPITGIVDAIAIHD